MPLLPVHHYKVSAIFNVLTRCFVFVELIAELVEVTNCEICPESNLSAGRLKIAQQDSQQS